MKNVNSQWNKLELDSRYLVSKYNNRTGDLLSLLLFFKNELRCVFDKPTLYSFLFR